MGKITNKIASLIPHDKLLHFSGGFIIFGVNYRLLGIWWAIGILLALAVLKEILDTKFDIWDIVAAILGGLSYYLINLL